ncbi:hypothetical protein [Gracilimonas sp.]|uniref:hypothetical protein n=1 Tax=Gracilimonas sp. TaxID=1974203 RepID=UPI003BAB4121
MNIISLPVNLWYEAAKAYHLLKSNDETWQQALEDPTIHKLFISFQVVEVLGSITKKAAKETVN